MPTGRSRRSFYRILDSGARGAARKVAAAGAAAYGTYRKAKSMQRSIRRANKGNKGSYSSSVQRKLMMPRSQTVKSFSASTGNELSVTKVTSGSNPRINLSRLYKLMQVGMNETVLRYQGITNFDVNVGWHALANRTDVANNISSPVHVYDLTAFPNVQTSTAVAGYWYYWAGTGSGATLNKLALRGQAPDGTTDATGVWHVEQTGRSDITAPYATRLLHNWVDIRLNLYGARQRGTTYTIKLVQFMDEFTNPIYGATTNKGILDWIRTEERPLIYSNLQSYGATRLKGKMKVVRSFKVYVPGGSADDLDTIGKVKEFRIFHKLNKVYNMKWESDTTGQDNLPHAQDDGIDYTPATNPLNYPNYPAQLFLIVKAFSPERRSVANIAPSTEAAALTEPSYDIVIRNKYSTPV